MRITQAAARLGDPAALLCKPGPVASMSDSEVVGWWTRFQRGVIAGLSVPVLGLILLGLPVMLAWLVPGSDSVSAGSAVRAAAIATLAGLRGGVVLDGQLLTLAPLTVSLLLAWLLCGPARRMDSRIGLAGLNLGFCLCCTAMAHWLRLGHTYAPLIRTAVASEVFVLLISGLTRGAPVLWARCGRLRRRVLVCAAAVCILYVGVASVLIAASLAVHSGQATALQSNLAPGAGGLAVLLIGLAALPNAVLMAIGYLSGAGFQLGAYTSVSPLSVSHGSLPQLPILAAVPGAGHWSAIGLTVVVLTAVGAGAVTVAMIDPLSNGWRGMASIPAVAGLVGLAVLIAATITHGGVSGTALQGVGVPGWRAGAGLAALVLAGSVLATGAGALLRVGRARGSRSELATLSTVALALPGRDAPAEDVAEVEVSVPGLGETG